MSNTITHYTPAFPAPPDDTPRPRWATQVDVWEWEHAARAWHRLVQSETLEVEGGGYLALALTQTCAEPGVITAEPHPAFGGDLEFILEDPHAALVAMIRWAADLTLALRDEQ